MNEKNIVSWLIKTPIFENFKVNELEEIASDERQFLKFNQGDKIIQEGESDSTLFILLIGNVKVTRKSFGNEEILLTNLGPGSLFGEMTGLKKQGRRTSTVTAENTCIVMLLKNYFLRNLSKDLIAKIKDELIRTILGRFDRLEGKYVQLITSNKIEDKKQ